MSKKAIIIGAGPAGLTAALELLEHTDITPIVIESETNVGGISKTINYKGNLIDLGGHRFFSKSDTILKWWSDILPFEKTEDNELNITYHNSSKKVSYTTTANDDKEKVMLVRNRKSRIFYQKIFFPYPLTFSFGTLRRLGVFNTIEIGMSYFAAVILPKRKENNLEDFFINRFGKKLYLTFFKQYTEKVWGVPCKNISAEWGKQRVKSLSLIKTVIHFITKKLGSNGMNKSTETSLIEKFLYPKYGPGQMWETVAEKIIDKGGLIYKNYKVTKIEANDTSIKSIQLVNQSTNQMMVMEGDYFFSTMPVRDLINGMNNIPSDIKKISDGLIYRDFIIVGVLLKKLKPGSIDDNWIYVQDPDVKVARIQFFNNWSPGMVADKNTVWIGAEYFCNENDEFWNYNNDKIIGHALEELERIGMIDKNDYCDATVIKVPKAYPAYFGSYSNFDKIRFYLDRIENLYLIGRNGMHKYNNQDHSMLTAIKAVELIKSGNRDKSSIWEVNTAQEYHEEK